MAGPFLPILTKKGVSTIGQRKRRTVLPCRIQRYAALFHVEIAQNPRMLFCAITATFKPC